MSKQDTNDLFDLELAPGSVDSAMSDAGAQRPRGTYKVPREHIQVIDGFNIRNANDPAYKTHLRFLADSMKANGYMEDKPLAGYVAKDDDGKSVVYVTDGHSRLLAVDIANAEGAEITSIPVVVKPKGTSMEDLTIALYTSNTGKPLTTFETAELCKRLVGYGMDEKTVAKRLGFKAGKKYVDDLLTLVAAPREVRELVASGKVSASLAIDMLKTDGAKAGKKLKAAAEKAQAEGKSKVTPKSLKAEKHADDIMIDALAKTLKARLAEKRLEGKSGWDDETQCTFGTLLAGADRHRKAGNIIDQIAYLAMLDARGATAADVQAMLGTDVEEGSLV